MEARLVTQLPAGAGWQFEPKWDGFRCLAFRDGDAVVLQSKAGQPLTRYFPEIEEAVRRVAGPRFVIDGEIVVPVGGVLSFERLLLRIHPSEKRVRLLAGETPGLLLAFDLLVDETGRAVVDEPLARRRGALEAWASRAGVASLTGRPGSPAGARGEVLLSPATTDRRVAERWTVELRGPGIDGVVAKRLDEPYRSGERTAVQKVKWLRTADCVVGGFRWATGQERAIGSLLLGLYGGDGLLHHVGFCAAFAGTVKRDLVSVLEPLIEPPAFTGRAPGGPSRWSGGRSAEWVPVRPVLVVEVRFHHFSEGRFRAGTQLVRWRPDKDPRDCTYAQLGEPEGAWTDQPGV